MVLIPFRFRASKPIAPRRQNSRSIIVCDGLNVSPKVLLMNELFHFLLLLVATIFMVTFNPVVFAVFVGFVTDHL